MSLNRDLHMCRRGGFECTPGGRAAEEIVEVEVSAVWPPVSIQSFERSPGSGRLSLGCIQPNFVGMDIVKTSKAIRKHIAFAVSLGFSLLTLRAQSTPANPSSAATSPSGPAPQFEVASIRQNLTPVPRWRMHFTGDGVSAMDVTLFYAIEEAYGLYDDQFWSGVLPWTREKRFDIEAKYDVEKYPNLTGEQRKAMLQQLLADRFHLAVHRESKEFPIYTLEIAKGGPKFTETKPEDLTVSPVYGVMCHLGRMKTGPLEMKGCTTDGLAKALTAYASNDLGRTIVDRTGLTGHYNFTVNWSTDVAPAANTLDAGSGPSIFTAVQEQLGLVLKAGKGSLETIVIDHVEMPTEN
jgi:uncharacterized protein (TIGR03435 family)